MSLIHIAREGQSLGTFKEEEVTAGIQSGRFLAGDLAWKEGMKTWSPLHTIVKILENNNDQKEQEGALIPSEPSWEHRSKVGFFKAIFQTIAGILFRPTTLFPAIKREGKMLSAFFYYFFLSSLSFLLGFFVHNPFLIGFKIFTVSHGFFPILFVGVCLLIAVASIVLSGIVHLSFKLVRGVTYPWKVTFCLFCYALGSTAIFQVVPFLDGLQIASFWGALLFLFGLRKVNQTSIKRLFFATLILAVWMIGLFFAQLFLFVKFMDLLQKYFKFLS